MPMSDRIGYVLKMYPRFSETFVLTEMLALEAAGTDLAVYSMRHPVDGRFHPALAELRAPVTYLPAKLRPSELWQLLRTRQDTLPDLGAHLDLLLSVTPDEAAAAADLAARARADGLTHLHAHFGSTATTVARVAARIAGIGYSFTAHAKDIFHADVVHDDLSVKLREADFVVTVSDYNLAHLQRTFGADADRVIRLYNGLDLTAFTPHTGPRERRVAAVGRLVEKKGFGDLLTAAALLRDAGTPVPVEIAGTGPEEHALLATRDRLGLTELVTFHGALPQHRVRQLVATSGAFAAPCVVGTDGNRDGLPTVLLESMALGTPVVSTPVTGIPEAVLDGDTGLLVPEADPTALASAIARILDDGALADALSRQGRSHVEEHFDTARNSAALGRLFAHVRQARPLQAVVA
ncbi:glycosyltransferase family 4 protein [Pseudactinotalea sp.]|uniref:glycosyltransferase family 4 protein n=1 Tax=Pseudactinotalea sp. TaxID=1926260 RepID=UPI003B3B991A